MADLPWLVDAVEPAGSVNTVDASLLITPEASADNGIVVKAPSDAWGDPAVIPYGHGQAFMLLRADDPAAATIPDDLVVFRVSALGGVGMAGGIHVGTGMHERAGAVENYSIYIQPVVDCAGILVDAVTNPTTPWQQWRTQGGADVVAEIDSTGKLKANRNLDVLSGAAATAGAINIGRTGVEVSLVAQGTGAAILAGAAAGDLVLTNIAAGRFVLIGAGVGGQTAAIRAGNNTLAFHGTAPIAKAAVTGSRAANAALASLLTALANKGLITDSTTA